MRLLDRLIMKLLRGPVDALVAEKIAEKVAELKLDALYQHRWHGRPERLKIHETAVVNNALFNVSGGTITVGKDAFFGHDVAVLTGTHDIDKFGRERQLAIPRSGRDIVIGEGAWVASNAMVLGPCVIGANAVVGGGSLVMGDVAPYTIVAGAPARVLRTIPHDDDPGR